jgi:two-component sensor histidine kinase
MDDTTAPEAGTWVQDRIGMDLTILPEMHIVVEDTARVERAAVANETARPNDKGQIEWLVGTNFDITDSKTASMKLKAAFNEKEVLLKEVYHRVKNNLQVVSSLINLQARAVKNEEAKNLLRQSADRVKAMALIHEKLYQSDDLAKIDISHYLKTLADSLLYSYNIPPGQIKIIPQISVAFLDIERAIPCGLIINELLSNTLKHAFPQGQAGIIEISLSQEGNEYRLVVADNGVGLPEGLDINNSPSLGLKLILGLAMNQLKGRIAIDQNHGTAFTIHFPMQTHEAKRF